MIWLDTQNVTGKRVDFYVSCFKIYFISIWTCIDDNITKIPSTYDDRMSECLPECNHWLHLARHKIVDKIHDYVWYANLTDV